MLKTSRHASQTSGGICGHWLRRFIHLSIIIYPWLYYSYGQTVADFLQVSQRGAVIVIVIAMLALELIRICFGLTVWGQRQHETRQLSSFAWTVLGVAVAVLMLPFHYAFIVVLTTAIIDPLVGEFRARGFSAWIVELIGLVVAWLIWFAAAYGFGVAWWWVIIMPPVILAVEWPSFTWVDDNFLMMVVPTLILFILHAS